MGVIVNMIVTTLIQFDGIPPLLTARHYEERSKKPPPFERIG